MACTVNYNYHLVARRHYILTTQGGGHESARPTPIQLGQLETVETETVNGKWKWKMEMIKLS